jgi:hypothetical protein
MALWLVVALTELYVLRGVQTVMLKSDQGACIFSP